MFELGPLHAHLDSLGARALQLRTRLLDLEPCGDALIIAVGREFQGSLKSGDGQIQQLFLPIEPVQGKVIDGEFGMRRSAARFQGRRQWPGRWRCSLRIALNPSPEIGFIGHIKGQSQVGARVRRGSPPPPRLADWRKPLIADRQ